MLSISEKFARIEKNINAESVSSGGYLGVIIYAYRRKRKVSRKKMADQWGMDEDSLLRIECGFGSQDEIRHILSKVEA